MWLILRVRELQACSSPHLGITLWIASCGYPHFIGLPPWRVIQMGRKSLFPLGREAKSNHDEGEPDSDIHECIEVLHDRDILAGNVEHHEIDQTQDKAGDHGGC